MALVEGAISHFLRAGRVTGQVFRSIGAVGLLALAVSGCTMSSFSGFPKLAGLPLAPAAAPAPDANYDNMIASYTAPVTRPPANIDVLIARYSALYDVPEALIRRVIVRESGYNPRARNGPYWGLMQIRYDTAQSMGYRGPASGLLDADTNLRYGVKYLAGAYIVGGRNHERAVRFYASGYYYDAKRQGLLDLVGL